MDKRDPGVDPGRDSRNEQNEKQKLSADLSAVLEYQTKRNSASKEPQKSKRNEIKPLDYLSDQSRPGTTNIGGRQPGQQNLSKEF